MFDKKKIDKPLKYFEYNSFKISEKVTDKSKFIQDLSIDSLNDAVVEIIQTRTFEKPIDSLLTEELPISDLNFTLKDIQIFGEYFPDEKEIIYYGKNDFSRIVQIHERYHAIHHLAEDPVTKEIWKLFSQVDSFYKELLAQLFTYRFIMDFEPKLEKDFIELNKQQSFKYQTWRFFRHFDLTQTEALYWEIRNACNIGCLKMFNSLHLQINFHLVKSLTFICKNPSIFVSETDVHQLVMRELMNINELNPDKTLYDTSCTIGISNKGKVSKKKYQTMLMHKEYGHADSRFSRSDIVILNPLDINLIDDPINLKQGKKWLIPDYIFEFGTEKSAGGARDFEAHFKSDLEKVAKAKKQGFVIHIQRNYYKRKSGKPANDKKYRGYLNSLMKQINLFKGHPTYSGKNPKIIFIILDLGGKGRGVRVKTRILKDPFHTTYCKLTGITKENISSELKSLIF